MDMQAILASPIPMLVLMVGVFYFLLIRPQQKRAKEHRDMIEALKRGETPETGSKVGRKGSEPEGGFTTLTAEGA